MKIIHSNYFKCLNFCIDQNSSWFFGRKKKDLKINQNEIYVFFFFFFSVFEFITNLNTQKVQNVTVNGTKDLCQNCR